MSRVFDPERDSTHAGFLRNLSVYAGAMGDSPGASASQKKEAFESAKRLIEIAAYIELLEAENERLRSK
jgi:hypothetical protein